MANIPTNRIKKSHKGKEDDSISKHKRGGSMDLLPSVIAKKDRHLSDGPRTPGIKIRTKRELQRTSSKKVNLSDFKILKKIGKGGYGEVYLVEHKGTGKKLALKQMQKDLIAKTDKVEHIKNERNILIKSSNPCLINLHYSFQDTESLYLVMDYCPGGDLRSVLDTLERLEEEDAALYFAEMITAVHHLHQIGYIHRLAKGVKDNSSKLTTNINVDKDTFSSHIIKKSLMPNHDVQKLTPQNFNQVFSRTRAPTNSRIIPSSLHPQRLTRTIAADIKTFSVVGSPNYMSPEVLGDHGYGEEVDWWSLGCVFFEIVMGFPPFSGETPEEIFSTIREWKTLVPALMAQYKLYMSPECYSLLCGLLSEPNTRLGVNIQTLKEHPFFIKNKIDWDKLSDHVPPFIPNLKNDTDTSLFEGRLDGKDFARDLTKKYDKK